MGANCLKKKASNLQKNNDGKKKEWSMKRYRTRKKSTYENTKHNLRMIKVNMKEINV